MRFKGLLIAIFIILFISITASTIIPLFNSPTGQATQASFSVCINQPPNLNYSHCNLSLQQNAYYACPLEASDYDGDDNFTYYVQNISSSFIFNITDEGVLTAQPGNDFVGNHLMSITVSDPSGCANNADSEQINFEVINVNDPPVFLPPLGPFEWTPGTSLRSIFLHNYFMDPDGDSLTFTMSNAPNPFLISIAARNELILSSSDCGDGYFSITATDPFGASVTSSPISLSVPCPTEQSSSGGGGGSGGDCKPDWQCGDWSRCYENNTQNKECGDVAQCKDDILILSRNCTFIPSCQNGILDLGEEGVDCGGVCPNICETCSDGIRNQDENGVDCGGSCPTCMNCQDGIKNFGEEDVDCGGPCPSCPTCFDGIRNQDETGVDCGGSCPACTELQTPEPVSERDNALLIWLLGVVATMVVLALVYRFFHKQINHFVTRLMLLFLPRRNKEILLSNDQRDSLLEELAYIESQNLLVNSQKEQRARYQDNVASILRKFFVIVVGPIFTTEDAQQALKKINTSKTVKNILYKQFIQLQSLEQDSVMDVMKLRLHTELLRQKIFSLSTTNKEITARNVTARSIKGSLMDQEQALLFNALLALQFENISSARSNYLKALSVYDSLSSPEQATMFGLLHIIFDDIKYVASYA